MGDITTSVQRNELNGHTDAVSCLRLDSDHMAEEIFVGKNIHLSLFTREVGFTQVKISGKDKAVSPSEIYLTWVSLF